MKPFEGRGSATLIGSMPHKDREIAVDLIFRSVPEIPVWPQLTAYPTEQMMAQYNEGLPGLVSEQGRVYVRSNTPEFDAAVYSFYEDYLALEGGSVPVEGSRFAMGPETAASFHIFLQKLRERRARRDVDRVFPSFRALKGQVSGPFTLLSGLKDQDGRALVFDERFQDITPKLLGLKAKWQIEHLGEFGVPVIIFLDEPALAGFGSSAFITVSAELVRLLLSQVVETVHAAGGLAGIHVCANTDWLLAFGSDFDIINFDAYTYFDRFVLYRKECLEFVARGGNLAWGVVPTLDLDAIKTETPQSLFDRWTSQVQALASKEMPAEKILAQSLFTPSCGCGSLPEPAAERALELLGGFCRLAV